MSFILDALKKSELERQRQTVPGLMDTRLGQRRRRLPLWAMAIAGLLGVNLILLLVVLTRGSTPSGSTPGVSVTGDAHGLDTKSMPHIARPSSSNAAATPAEHFSPLDTTPVYAPEIPVPATDKPSSIAASTGRGANTGTAATGPGTSASVGGVRVLRRPDPLLIDEDTQADNLEVLPSINEINLTGAQALPDLHLDVHVYATKPAERFVYINMHKYHEGARLQEGPILERIRRDGVVLNDQGLRFILPRQP